MTYQEIIDNIQTRIENIIAQRLPDTFNVTTLSVSEYNPTIDDTVTVTVTMEDQNGDPITGQTVPLYIDNNSVSGLTTDSNGQCTYNYTCEDWGTHTFQVNGKTIQITVTGKRTTTQTNYTISHDDKFVYFTLHSSSSLTGTTSWKDYGTVFGENTSPANTVQFMEQYGALILRVQTNGKLQYRSITGSNVSATGLVAYAIWEKQ